ncbi:right-handed parallel beta-helix repeat-containing protein [Gracilibacillus timonensis]|uniref:right-handed parallel beta-helix repeat-containing protein n=1 Tax=Gracilibacillus timonensis TaxID=1816696 RepID=UPI00082711F7|nr:right-handed parallel beta-helix repeat-containing protein [Gracilibacillus timonensis]
MTEYHVAKNGSISNSGTTEQPFLEIQQAAEVAQVGDTIIVHEGEYREWVRPRHGGLSERRPITYQTAPGEKAVIKGSEAVTAWEKVTGTTWKKEIPNAWFGEFNPFDQLVWGDWLSSAKDRDVHLGEVYLNGQAMYETTSREKVETPESRDTVEEFFVFVDVEERYPERMQYTWFAEVDETHTTIFANFQEYDPNEELIEINVRPACFYPETNGRDYIILRGFEICHAACPWAPPTGDQPGMIGPRWSKGWIIEDNVIHNAKCSAISLGKVAESGDNYYGHRLDKPGYTYQLESVFTAEDQGWSKERIGSHIVRRNHIYDCGQNGIVGHLGCVFSKIYDNHIHDMSMKREFRGWEIAGIKLHAAIDVEIRHNHIHDCSCGTWLDWQTQGTRIRQNIFYDNGLDFFVEVSHGPYLVENNIFASRFALRNLAQGGAYINNLIAGNIDHWDVRDRATPYHLEHSTKVKGYAVVYGGDDRYYNNMFIGRAEAEYCGTSSYDGHHTSLEDYITEIQEDAPTDVDKFLQVKDPVYIENNIYWNQATAFAKEQDALVMTYDPQLTVSREADGVYVTITLPEEFAQKTPQIHSSETLGRVRLVDAEFENPDGSALTVDTDLTGEAITKVCGPLQALQAGENKLKIWG